ncbi:MAG: DNA polymerase III, partial [Candidatus Omnitrophica bacterium]|nr:DNA polymerase III [Candidatus Omnitrophota bacterium]
MKNRQVAKIFRQVAEILEIQSENPFRIRAYLKAAQNIESLSQDLADLTANNELEKIPGVGKDLAEKIKEIVSTGRLKLYEQLEDNIPEGLTILMSVPGLGPKTARRLYEELNIKDIKDLERAVKGKRLSGLPGIKNKTEENILRGIALIKKAKARMPLLQALSIAGEFVRELNKIKGVRQIEPAGSLRRRKETVRDIDLLITSAQGEKVNKAFIKLPQIKRVLACGSTKSSTLTKDNVQVDLRVVPERSFGAALLYFTGSK